MNTPDHLNYLNDHELREAAEQMQSSANDAQKKARPFRRKDADLYKRKLGKAADLQRQADAMRKELKRRKKESKNGLE